MEYNKELQITENRHTLYGLAASTGRAYGPARIVFTADEAECVQPGDILITPTASIQWIVLFPMIAALVTDVGGILSDCAIAAREYNMPAVVGTQLATLFFNNGQILEVDGANGIVRSIDLHE